MNQPIRYETPTPNPYPDPVRVDAIHKGVAFRVHGVETQPDADTEWTGIESHTGRLVVVMVGDNHRYSCDPEDVTELERAEFCGECGQIGCTHDGLDRGAE